MSEFVDKAMELAAKIADGSSFGTITENRAVALRQHLEAREAVVEKLVAALERYVASDVSMDSHNGNKAPSNLQSSNLHRSAIEVLALARGEKP